MAVDTSQALEWAKNNPNDPRAKNIQAKAWALQNPDDPRSDQILAKIHSSSGAPETSAAAQPGGNPFDIASNQQADAKAQTQNNEASANMAATLKGLATKAVGTGAGLIAGVAKGATLGNVDFPHILGLDRDPNTELGTKIGNVEGTIGTGAALGGALPEAGTALGRIASTTAQGALMGGAQAPSGPSDDRLTGLLHGAAVGGTLGAAGEGLQALLSGVGRAGQTAKQAYQMSHGDPGLQSQARGAIGEAAEALGSQTNRPDLDAKLQAAKVQINPTQFMGHTPEVDQILRNEIAQKSPMGTIPSSMEVSGDTLNQIRRALDSGLPWKQQAYQSLNPQQIKAGGDMLDAANSARNTLHSISPDVDQAFNDIHNAYSGQAALNKMSDKPLTALTSKNLDQKANISALGEQSGTDIADLANQLRSAKKVSNHPVTGTPQLVKQGIKGAANSLTGSDTGVANNPTGLSAILSLLK